VVLFEHLKHAEMREAARKTTSKRESDAWPCGRGGCTIVQVAAQRVFVPRHDGRIAGSASSLYGSRVLKTEYFGTAMETSRIRLFRAETVRNY
jgi:hypothetical protein